MIKVEIDIKEKRKSVEARGMLPDIMGEIVSLIDEVANVVDEDEGKFMYYKSFFEFAFEKMKKLQDK